MSLIERITPHRRPELRLVDEAFIQETLYPPQETEGVFDSSGLPTYATYVDPEQSSEIKIRNDMNKDAGHGTWFSQRQVMDDGLELNAYFGKAEHSRTNTVIAITPPWCTREDAGLTPYIGDMLMEIGYDVVIKGIARNRAAALSRNAYDMHALLDSFSHDEVCETEQIYVTGGSNGGMVGTGVASYSGVFDRPVIGAYLVDPCIVRRPKATDAFTGVHDLRQAPAEAISLLRQIRRQPKENHLRIAKTVLPSRHFFKGNALMAPGLFSGEFGDLLDNIPTDQTLHYLMFTKSIGNQIPLFREKLLAINRPNVTYEERLGTHMSILNPSTIESTIGYFALELEKHLAA